MAITRTAMVDDDGSGTTGTIINNAWKVELYNQIDGAIGSSSGAWVDVAHNPIFYSTPTGGAAFTATSSTYQYAQNGKTMWLSINVSGTSTGAPGRFHISPPVAPNRGFSAVYWYRVGTAEGAGIAFMAAGQGYIDCLRDLVGTPFPAGATQILLEVMFTVP